MALAILAHDHFLARDAKTAEALIRYGQDPVVAVVDRAVGSSSTDATETVGPVGEGVPVVPTMEDALDLEPDTVAIGVAPVGGQLPKDWRNDVTLAVEQGLDVISGMHEFLSEDPSFSTLAEESGAELIDVRRPPEEKPIYSGEVLDLPCTVVLTVGTDCSSGKMTTTVEVARELAARGREVAVAATGQTGIMIGADAGVVVDAVPADFVAGWTERIVIDAYRSTEAEVVLVEGQGAITHPAYAGVSLGILHGASPHGCLLCHDASRREKTTGFHGGRRFPVEDPLEEWTILKKLGGVLRAPELLGVSAMHLADDHRQLTERIETIPVVDVLGDGPGRLADAVEAIL